MRAIGYIRVSGKSQVEGDGPDRQRIAIEAFCQDNEVELQGIRFEKAVSGTVEGMDRPEFSSILEHIKANPTVDAIVVEHLDRLARDLMVQEVLLRDCRDLGIQVFSVDSGRLEDVADNSGDPTRVMVRQIMGAIAQCEKSRIVGKLGGARARVKAETGRCEGRKPFGEGKDLYEKRVLHALIEMREAGIKSRFIGNALAQQGLGNPKTGKPYTRNFINRLIARHCKNTP
jgi:DNA invertase Pin-like site-specific DNA recombinase